MHLHVLYIHNWDNLCNNALVQHDPMHDYRKYTVVSSNILTSINFSEELEISNLTSYIDYSNEIMMTKIFFKIILVLSIFKTIHKIKNTGDF